ncbi:MAG: hypothetical protein WDA02_10710 [Saccharofermentanales bacterium]
MKHLMTFENYSILGSTELIKISNEQGESIDVYARIDTGSKSSKISSDIAKKLKLPVVKQKKVWSPLGEDDRVFVECQMNINGIEIKTDVGIADMSDMSYQVMVGRKDIEMVDGIVDIKKDKRVNIEDIPNEQDEPINVIMTQKDLNIIGKNDNINIIERLNPLPDDLDEQIDKLYHKSLKDKYWKGIDKKFPNYNSPHSQDNKNAVNFVLGKMVAKYHDEIDWDKVGDKMYNKIKDGLT